MHNLGAVAYSCNSTSWRLLTEDHKFKANIDYTEISRAAIKCQTFLRMDTLMCSYICFEIELILLLTANPAIDNSSLSLFLSTLPPSHPPKESKSEEVNLIGKFGRLG